ARHIASHLLESKCFKESKSISCFLSMPGEVNSRGIGLAILEAGKQLFVPKIIKGKDSHIEMLRVYDKEDLETLPAGVWGIREPDLTWRNGRRASGISSVDLVLLPGIAFDRSMSRIGYGKGYYDRFLTTYHNQPHRPKDIRPQLVALGFDEQVVDAGEVPTEDHDWKLDGIVTSQGFTWPSPDTANTR
ncbi:nagb/rpia/CoA transferase-like protein, partial [Sistotremastrum niveocremeum HHB9708]